MVWDVKEAETTCVESVGDRGYIDASVPLEDRPTIKDKKDLLQMYPECFEQGGKYFKNFEYGSIQWW